MTLFDKKCYNHKFCQFKKIILCSNNENFEYFNFALLSKMKKKILHQAKKKNIFLVKLLKKYILVVLMQET